MKKEIGLLIFGAGLAALSCVQANVGALADDTVFSATLDGSDEGASSLPAYVPLENLGAFLTAAWRTTAPKAHEAGIAKAEEQKAVSIPSATHSDAQPAPVIQAAVIVSPAVASPASSPAAMVSPAVATLSQSEATQTVTTIAARPDDLAAKPVDVAPLQTPVSADTKVEKDAVEHVLPAAVVEAAGTATKKPPSLRAPSHRVASLSKPRAKDRHAYRDWQVGVAGQSMEPLISTCAQSRRTCTDSSPFCGC